MSESVARWDGRVRALVAAGRDPSRERIVEMVNTQASRLGARGVDDETAMVERSLLGLGPLEEVVADPCVTDVLVNGDGSVWVDRGHGVERSRVSVPTDSLRALAVRLAAQAGRRLDDAQPWVDGRLPGGARLHAIIPPLVEVGAHVSLRIPRASPGSVAELVSLGSCCAEVGAVLTRIVHGGLNFLVCGGTGTGKTTVLAGLVSEVPAQERVVIVEDVTELAPMHPHVVRLQGRSMNVEGQGQVTMVDLVRQALRMRPDRLVVGEVRGGEVRELLTALNTGHAGAGTVHANSARDLPSRLHALGALAGLQPAAVEAHLRSAVDVVIAMAREGAVRRVVEVSVLRPDGPDGVHCVPALASPRPGVLVRGPAWAVLEARLDRQGRGGS